MSKLAGIPMGVLEGKFRTQVSGGREGTRFIQPLSMGSVLCDGVGAASCNGDSSDTGSPR